MSDSIRWGILGTGKIAKAFANGLSVLPDAQLLAVGSRQVETAEQFGDNFQVPRRYADYESLLADPDVDVVYIATPHAVHHEHLLLALEAGKPVLCEKPFTMNATQAQEAISLARRKGLFLMEAMWTRYIPLVAHLRQMLADGVIGKLEIFEAGMAFVAPRDDPSRYFFRRDLGGGILLDGGCYSISMASMVLGGPPRRIVSMADMGQSEVDEQSAAILGYDGGQMAIVYVSFRTRIPPSFRIMGSLGRITVHPPLFNPTRMTVSLFDGQEEVIEMPFEGNGMNFEAAEVAKCLRTGKLESDIMPLDETLSILRTLDEIRGQWGLRYPME
jgi:predicted dehydrogenase